VSVPLRSSLLSQDRFARAAWSRVAEPGDPVANRLIRTHGPVEALLVAASGVGQKVERFLPRLEVLDVERDLEVGAKFAARIVCPGDPEWPQGLDDLVAPPYCLWVRGPIDVASSCQRSAAVVGARSATAYGEMVATEMAAGLGERRSRSSREPPSGSTPPPTAAPWQQEQPPSRCWPEVSSVPIHRHTRR